MNIIENGGLQAEQKRSQDITRMLVELSTRVATHPSFIAENNWIHRQNFSEGILIQQKPLTLRFGDGNAVYEVTHTRTPDYHRFYETFTLTRQEGEQSRSTTINVHYSEPTEKERHYLEGAITLSDEHGKIDNNGRSYYETKATLSSLFPELFN